MPVQMILWPRFNNYQCFHFSTIFLYPQSPAAAKKQKLAISGTTSAIASEKSSKPFEVEKDEQVLSLANTGESMPVSEHGNGLFIMYTYKFLFH